MPKFTDLKSTLNLPKTAFPMKAGLPQSEPKQLAEWESQGLYRKILASREEARKAGRIYVLHDGPPYPTGEIHLGTGLNKTLKDMVVKSRSMSGYYAPYVPGWDCHGLPIETKVEKELPGGKGSIPPAEFRRRCREFAVRFIDIHRREFKRLGVFGRWEDPYLTMSFPYEAAIADTFLTFLEKGYVYKGLKPVYWCIHDSTALAEAEVEYDDHTSPSIWVKFRAVGGAAAAKLPANTDAVIWTTTPWTLPHNRALAFHPEFAYVAVETSAGTLLLAEQLLPATAQACGFTSGEIRGRWKGRELEGLQFQHPFLEKLQVPGVLAEYVTLDTGTGIVHTAPGHGVDDFYTGQRYGIDARAPMDDAGRYTEGLPEYQGKTVFEANPHIIELLKSRGALLAGGKLTHSYPHCWRCHQPVIFRATEQWFIEMDKPGAEGPLRARAAESIRKVQWTPGWGQERLQEMVAGRPDWCISRQRMWGVPIVVFHCAQCGKRLEDIAALRHVVRTWFTQEGADAWFSRSAEELLPPDTACACGSKKWSKENDILDVWFDSGSSHMAVLGTPELPWPADMYLEGPDQYRGWFQSSLLIGVGAKGRAPYNQVFTHGWTLDEKGVPMSKSLGNAIFPKEICERWGADLLRTWVASQDYHADVRMSERVMTQLSESYRKIRNTFRYVLGNLEGFAPAQHAVPGAQMLEMDRWMLERTALLVQRCRAHYDAFEFQRVFHAIHDFCVVELSAFYFDVLKDRLYTSARMSAARRSAQTAVWRIGEALVRLLAPILVFSAEEVWRYMPHAAGAPESVHMAVFPDATELRTGLEPAAFQAWEQLLGVRESVLQALEPARQAKTINSNLEAKIELQASGPLAQVLQEHARWLPALFIVSQVAVREAAPAAEAAPAGGAAQQAAPLRVIVQRADGGKCERCWNYSVHVGQDAEYPSCCERCVASLAELAAAE